MGAGLKDRVKKLFTTLLIAEATKIFILEIHSYF
jgi:hypothetical protein